jgi:hypothetical protein
VRKGGWRLELVKLIYQFTDDLDIWETQNSGTLKAVPGTAGTDLPLPLPLRCTASNS